MFGKLLNFVEVPTSRNGRNYSLVMMADAIGTSLIFPVTVVYLIEKLSFSPEDVATSLAAIGLISAFGAPISGRT